MDNRQESVQAIDEFLATTMVRKGYAAHLLSRRNQLVIEDILPSLVKLPGEVPVPREIIAHKLASKIMHGETTIEIVEKNISELL